MAVYGQSYPYPQQPPPPRKGMSTTTIVLIVVGCVLVLGAGSCVLLGSLVLLGASAEGEDAGLNGRPIATTPPSGTTAPAAPTEGEGEGEGNDPPPPEPTTAKAASGGAAPAPPRPAGMYSCTATGTARVCGFSNVCNNQFVTGYGSGRDQASASNSARVACQGQIVARGGSGGCSVACTFRTQ